MNQRITQTTLRSAQRYGLVISLVLLYGTQGAAYGASGALPPPSTNPSATPPAAPPRADFGTVKPSTPARDVAGWVAGNGDNRGGPFVIVDKARARLYVFDARGKLRADSAVLLGSARGDLSVPGIGERKMTDIAPHERTTPAGRFVAEAGRNTQGEDVIWVDYDHAVSMHRVRTANKKERRLARLATPTVADNRISYGCINVPAAFYDRHISQPFGTGRGVVYVLPEILPLKRFFAID